jgi:hypothetical protein
LKVIIGIPWCEERDYPRILEIMADADRLPKTFASWLEKAERAEQPGLDQGVVHAARPAFERSSSIPRAGVCEQGRRSLTALAIGRVAPVAG